MKEINIRCNDGILAMIVGVLLAAGFIWLNIFLFRSGNNFYILAPAFWGVFGTLECYGCIAALKLHTLRSSTRLCASGTAVAAVLLLTALLMELGTGGRFSVFGESGFVLWIFYLPKEYAFDIWTIVWFPYHIGVIFHNLRKEQFSYESVFFASVSVAGLTLEGILLFRAMPNVWQVNLLLLNLAAFAAAEFKYVFGEENISKRKAVAAGFFYVVLRIVLLPLQCGDWKKHLTLFLSDSTGRKGSLISSLLYFGSLPAVIGFLAALMCFLIVLVKLLGIKDAKKHKNWLVFATAASMLAFRTFFGFLYNLGIPYPVDFPFQDSVFMDVMSFTLVLICGWEEQKIWKLEHIGDTIFPAELLLGRQAAYDIRDEEGKPYQKENSERTILEETEDTVEMIGDTDTGGEAADSEDAAEKTICTVRCFMTESRRVFGIFTMPVGGKMGIEIRFLLEYTADGWILTGKEDRDILENIITQYKQSEIPDCMENDEEPEEEWDE